MPHSQPPGFALSWITHPALPDCSLGLCRCPGTRDGEDRPASALADDLAHLAGLGISCLVSLIDDAECQLIGAVALGSDLAATGLEQRIFPITDRSIPERNQIADFVLLMDDLSGRLDDGARLAVHCRAGLGRSGLVAASLLVRRGVLPDAAITAIRHCRPGAIETPGQEAFIHALAL
jgi:protein-tyrosine phosphatase